MREERRIIEFGELEGDRRATENSPNSLRQNRGAIPYTEVGAKKRRRRFSNEYKLLS